MKKGIEIPPAVIVVVLIVVVAFIGIIGYKVLLPPQRIHMNAAAIEGMKKHMNGSGSGAQTPGPGRMSAPHS